MAHWSENVKHPKDCGLLNRKDAREWKSWWTARGHQATTESSGRKGLVRCWLQIERETKPDEAAPCLTS